MKNVLIFLAYLIASSALSTNESANYELNDRPITSLLSFDPAVVQQVLDEVERVGKDFCTGDRNTIVNSANALGLHTLASISAHILSILPQYTIDRRLGFNYFINFSRDQFDREIAPTWHHHIAPERGGMEHLFLLTFALDQRLTTEYTHSTDFERTSGEDLIPRTNIPTQNIPANTLVYFPVSRAHRTPDPRGGVADYRRIHLALQVYGSDPLVPLFQDRLDAARNEFGIVHAETRLPHSVVENIVQYCQNELPVVPTQVLQQLTQARTVGARAAQ